jgi:glycosyltransferase involved in cell wall biosynthesis
VCCEYAWETISVRAGASIEEVFAEARTGSSLPTHSNDELPRHPVERRIEGKKIGFVSTYNMACGIAVYTEDLIAGLRQNNCEGYIFSSHALLAEQLHHSVTKASTGWFYDNVFSKHSSIDSSFIIRHALQHHLDHVSIQYHSGFFDLSACLNLIDALQAAQISSSVIFHNSIAFSQEQLAHFGPRQTTIFVHDATEAKRIRQVARVKHLPFGIHNAPVGKAVTPLTVGTFGFLRPHKGLFELISAFEIVTVAEPRAKLRAYCADYLTEESNAEKMRCNALISERRLHEFIEIDTTFRSKQDVLELLSACEVNVLAYHATDEGSSAAANDCIAARRPLIVSRSKIFEPLGEVAYRLESIEPSSVALAILGLLRNADLRADLKERTCRLAEERNWRNVAALFLADVFV